MKQTVVKTLARSARAIALTAVISGLGATALVAQNTGKLEGRIRDQGGQPIANASVRIVGGTAVATANPQGYYFFNNVPAGDVSIRVAYVGYKPKEVTGIRMISGQTITQDISLEQTPVQVQEITVVAAQNALVPRDEVTTKQLIDGKYADKLPVDRIGNVLALQPGVSASPGGGSLFVRGSRSDENTTYVDGVPVTSGNRGTGSGRSLGVGISVGTNSFEDASITTGAGSAEFGGSTGGLIAITTRAGGSKFSGNVGYETDNLASDKYSTGFNRFTASVGGPITKDFTFFVGGVLEGNETNAGNGVNQGRTYKAWEVPSFVRVGVDTVYTVAKTRNSPTSDSVLVPVYKTAMFRGECDNAAVANASDPDMRNNYGYDCHGAQNPFSPSTNVQLTSKLNYSFGQGSRLALSYLNSGNQNRGQRAADGTNATQTNSSVATLNWTQTLSKSATHAVALDAYLSRQWDRSINSTLTDQSEADTRDPAMGILLKRFDFLYGFDQFPVTDQLVDNFRTQKTGSAITLYDRDNTSQYAGNTGWNGAPDGLGASAGFGGTAPGVLQTATEDRTIAKLNLDWQLDRYNRVKFGGEYTKYNMTTYNQGATNQSFSDIWLAKPTRYNLFAEDRLDLGDVVLVGGLRYDYYDVGASKWADFPRISSKPGFNPDSVDNYLTPYQSHDYISPHIQVAFPVTERTNFRLSYAQQVQQPDFSVVLFGSNTDLSITNTNNNYGSDLDFGKSILFEFGVRHAFSDDMVLDMSVYNKDNLANPAGRLVRLTDPIGGDPNDIRLTVNQDFGNTRGLDLRLDRRFGNIFNGVLSYSFQQARNTGSDPYSYINFGSRIVSGLGGSNASPPQQAQLVNSSRPHSIAGQFAVNFPVDFKQGTAVGTILKQVGLFSTFRYASGTPYTRCAAEDQLNDNTLSGTVCGGDLAGDFNGARLPSYKEFNLRLTKGFAIGGLDLTAYVDGRNLLNIQNTATVFTSTGTTVNTESQRKAWVADSTTFYTFSNANGAYDAQTGNITLPSSNAACANYSDASSNSASPTCYYYRKSEQRFGDGDGIYTLAEQRRASDNNQLANYHISRFSFAGRTMRFGMEVNF